MKDSVSQMNTAGLRRRRRWLWDVLAIVVIAIVAGWVWNGLRPAPESQQNTVTVERGDIEKTVTAVGALQPKEYVDVGTQVSGQLQKVHVDIGDRVTKGDLIAEIDPTRYESTVRNDRASLQSLRAQLLQKQAERELAQQQLERNQRMLAERAVSQDTVDQSRATAKVAKAAVAALQAQIAAAEATLEGNLANLGYTKIYAPMDGTVVSQTSLEGQTVNATQSAPVIVQVANLDVMTVWAQVAEADVNKIKPEMAAYFTTLGNSGRRWRGTVRQVQPTPETENNVVLYNVLIDVDNAEQLLLPSMTVQVFFVLGQAHDVPLVALSALTADPSAGPDMFRATVLTEQGVVPRQVQVGVTNRATAQVVSGLEVGDRVVVDTSVATSAESAAGQRNGTRRPMMPHL
ncbi:efflux RND transporter periplasmic adaptor subunit [Sinimarinibacterium sp. CAU 1509]|uniref:efflux RND transporter periplasmic adaptor subunit n=1 Tax=Sinimarinibacterium sp. CAU 1509 TaxID=2562283 RepID=UPI00146E1050|nr:efflux RND transporter periplasmic adaptor subunit [Sinimarinibacterium sp. CAU 1509]